MVVYLTEYSFNPSVLSKDDDNDDANNKNNEPIEKDARNRCEQGSRARIQTKRLYISRYHFVEKH
jgi:ribosomal protein S14